MFDLPLPPLLSRRLSAPRLPILSLYSDLYPSLHRRELRSTLGVVTLRFCDSVYLLRLELNN